MSTTPTTPAPAAPDDPRRVRHQMGDALVVMAVSLAMSLLLALALLALGRLAGV